MMMIIRVKRIARKAAKAQRKKGYRQRYVMHYKPAVFIGDKMPKVFGRSKLLLFEGSRVDRTASSC